MKTRRQSRRRWRRTLKQTGGALCKGDESDYQYDKDDVLGDGEYGTVYGMKGDPNLAVKVQRVPISGKAGEKFTHNLQTELAIATIAGEMGIGPRIHHLSICDVNPKSNTQTIMWVMDRINGKTLYDTLDKYKATLKKQGKTKEEIKKLEYAKRKEFHDNELIPMIQRLEEKGINAGDIHGGNIMYGYIRGGEPRLWIIDFGFFKFI